jgi:inner membrane transporter RhtA
MAAPVPHPPSPSGPDPRTAVGLILAGIGSVQLGSALATTLFEELGPGGAVFLRSLFAALILLAVWRPARAALDRSTRRDILLFGVVLAGMNLSFYQALDRLPLGIAVTLEFIGPLAVALAGSRSRLDFVWAFLAAAGILLFAPDIGDGLDPAGVGFALLAGFFWGVYIFVSARVGRGPVGFGGLSLAMATGALLLIPVGIADGGGDLLDPGLLAVGLGVALLSSVVPYTVELQALRTLSPKTFGVLLSLEPAMAALIGAIALDQALAGRELVAIALVVVASAGAMRTGAAPETPEA